MEQFFTLWKNNMPLYDYKCDHCSYTMEDVYQHMKDDSLSICPSCKNSTLFRVIYGGIYSSVKDVKTIGQLADKNWKNLGSYKRSEIENKNRDKSLQTVFPDTGKATRKEINKMNEQQRINYIMTGEK